jgi:hypothetical protein
MATGNRIFISYSSKDKDFVAPLAQLLRVAASSVFRDADNIPLGAEWRGVLAKAIVDCDVFLLFWCRHAAESIEVQNECQQAIAQNKSIIPVLLDDHQPPESISRFHGIDLRFLAGAHEEPVHGQSGTEDIHLARPSEQIAKGQALRVRSLSAEEFSAVGIELKIQLGRILHSAGPP